MFKKWILTFLIFLFSLLALFYLVSFYFHLNDRAKINQSKKIINLDGVVYSSTFTVVGKPVLARRKKIKIKPKALTVGSSLSVHTSTLPISQEMVSMGKAYSLSDFFITTTTQHAILTVKQLEHDAYSIKKYSKDGVLQREIMIDQDGNFEVKQ